MGAHYTCFVVLDDDIDEVDEALGRTVALLAPTDDAVVVFHDEVNRRDDIASDTSILLDRTVLAFRVFGSDVLEVVVWRRGRPIAQHLEPDPAHYFGGWDDAAIEYAWGPRQRPPSSADIATTLAELRGVDEGSIAAVLANEYVFAEQRHRDLLAVLRLPTWAATSRGSVLRSLELDRWPHLEHRYGPWRFEGPEVRATGGRDTFD